MHFFTVSVLGMSRRLDYIFKKSIFLRSSVSAHTSIAYHIYVYIYILLYLLTFGKNKSCRSWDYALYQLCISLLRGQLLEQNWIMSSMKLAISNWSSCNINACPFSRSPALAELPSLTVLIHCRQVWELLNIGWNLKLVIVWFILGLSGIQLLVPWFIGGFSSIVLWFNEALKEWNSAESYRLHPPEHISDQ